MLTQPIQLLSLQKPCLKISSFSRFFNHALLEVNYVQPLVQSKNFISWLHQKQFWAFWKQALRLNYFLLSIKTDWANKASCGRQWGAGHENINLKVFMLWHDIWLACWRLNHHFKRLLVPSNSFIEANLRPIIAAICGETCRSQLTTPLVTK